MSVRHSHHRSETIGHCPVTSALRLAALFRRVGLQLLNFAEEHVTCMFTALRTSYLRYPLEIHELFLVFAF
jgi:hypothetical protein